MSSHGRYNIGFIGFINPITIPVMAYIIKITNIVIALSYVDPSENTELKTPKKPRSTPIIKTTM